MRKIDVDNEIEKYKKEHGIRDELDFELDIKDIDKKVVCKGILAWMKDEADKYEKDLDKQEEFIDGEVDDEEDDEEDE